MTQANLMTHAGAQRVTRQELRGIATPLSTPTHRPIAHTELVDVLDRKLADAGYAIVREQFAVMAGGMRLFGTLDLECQSATAYAGTGLALGFRHANDKHMALSIVAGARVFVCDNMALSGDVKLFRNPHRHGVMDRLGDSLGEFCLRTLPTQFAVLGDRFDRWAHAGLTDRDAKVLIYDALARGIVPARLRADVHTAYFDADALGYQDSAPRTKLGLHNAFTRSLKALNPAPAYTANVGLTGLFDQ